MSAPASICFVVVLPGPRVWFDALSTAFTHPWVMSYQVGFGPPLVRAHDRLISAVRDAKSALEKLEAYLEHCYLDDVQRTRLAGLHRRLLVRRHGPVEVEVVRTASRHVLDLTVQLYPPYSSPNAVKDAMCAVGELEGLRREDPPEHRTGRFWLHLADPRNSRLLDVDAVRRRLVAPESQAAIAFTVPSVAGKLFAAWFEDWAAAREWPVIQLEGPVSAARTHRNGVGL